MIVTEKGNLQIAKYLGWFQEPDQVGSWFLKDDCAKYVVYSIYNNYPHRDLPFHRDFNSLMPVLNKIAADIKERYDGEISIDYYAGEVIVQIGDEPVSVYLGKLEPVEAIWLAVVRYLKNNGFDL